MLWGNFAKSLKKYITFNQDTLVLEWTHPSPLARTPFMGNNHFKLCNWHLKNLNIKTIKFHDKEFNEE